MPNGVMLATTAFAILAVLGTYSAVRHRRIDMNRAAYWHSALASLSHLLIAAYLLSFGIIGLMTWT